ncbi:hypothetical protein [Streptomyces sp. ME19-01-6]|uniref:hypothetical protein n=1 Tax=Streptomyces sp. ME19-01-6 TaxID=3028686 RepID=UPI0029B9E8D2|nr:hypothetical protein [Streptomyces sp. ME19-01-6]MDX3232985.1 hypothetical protein [Streptomyces sp. ME19-01-6]
MTEEARLELLTCLRTARRARLGRRGDLGPVVHALHHTADLMDAADRRRERHEWQQYIAGRRVRRPRPPFGWPTDPAQLMSWGPGFLAAYGLDSKEQWDEVRRTYTAPGGAGHKAWMAWLHERRAIRAEMEKLLLPSWRDSPSLTASDVRAIADRRAEDGAL